MKLDTIKEALKKKQIFFADEQFREKPTVIGYEKKFKWRWFATQLNTFIVATDFGNELITTKLIEDHMNVAFQYAEKKYNGWPRGLQSGVAVISVLISSQMDAESIDYCRKLKSGKKWAGITIPVIINSETSQKYSFDSNPIWGAIYYPHFRVLINELC